MPERTHGYTLEIRISHVATIGRPDTVIRLMFSVSGH
jgi:hypothetical protein